MVEFKKNKVWSCFYLYNIHVVIPILKKLNMVLIF